MEENTSMLIDPNTGARVGEGGKGQIAILQDQTAELATAVNQLAANAKELQSRNEQLLQVLTVHDERINQLTHQGIHTGIYLEFCFEKLEEQGTILDLSNWPEYAEAKLAELRTAAAAAEEERKKRAAEGTPAGVEIVLDE